MSWQDNAKIDGNKIKGFAKTDAGDFVYATYTFTTEEEKWKMETLNLPSFKLTVKGAFQEVVIPSHSFSFDMRKYLKTYGAIGYFQVDEIVEVKENRTFSTQLADQRRKVKKHIQTHFPEQLRTEAEALLIGDRSGMDEEEMTKYKRLGITHLFAISGLHVGLLTFFARELLLRLNVRRETASILLIVFLPMYAMIAGGAPSVWRAVSVTVLILFTTLRNVRISVLNALAMSAIGFVLIEPYIVFQPGFQLSYLAALALILSSKLLKEIKTALGLSFLVTSISQLALYPILLYHFYEISLSSFLTNLFYVPLYSVVILPTNLLLLGISYLAPFIANLLFLAYASLRSFIDIITNIVSSLPYQMWTPGRPIALLLVLAVVGVLIFFVLLERNRKAWWNYFVCLILPAFFIQIYPYTNSSLKVTYVDVGQGDSAIIELPYRKGVYVIDVGGIVSFGENDWKSPTQSFEVGRKVVVPYLKGNGITKVDKLILSHPHLDHVGGAVELMEEIRVREIHITPGSEIETVMEDIIDFAHEKKIPIFPVKDGASWKVADSNFMYLGPQGEKYVGGNNSSLVLFMKTTGPSFLFTGDMEQEAEAEFVKKYENLDFGTLILKAGHHGSKTSSTKPFINVLRPEYAIISAGRNNLYGHPHDETMQTFHEYNVPILLTSENGSITVTVEGESYSLQAAP